VDKRAAFRAVCFVSAEPGAPDEFIFSAHLFSAYISAADFITGGFQGLAELTRVSGR
jgi:hypothetical protein